MDNDVPDRQEVRAFDVSLCRNSGQTGGIRGAADKGQRPPISRVCLLMRSLKGWVFEEPAYRVEFLFCFLRWIRGEELCRLEVCECV